MKGEKKANLRSSRRKEVTLNSEPIQEYDFFVIRDEGDAEGGVPIDHPVKEKKRGSRNKSTSFFFSD